MNENKQREIIELIKTISPDSSGNSLKSLTEEDQKKCFFLFFELIDLWKEEMDQIINDDYVFFIGGNLTGHKISSLPKDQKAKCIFNKIKIEDLEDKLKMFICYTLKSHEDSALDFQRLWKEKLNKWKKEYQEKKILTIF